MLTKTHAIKIGKIRLVRFVSRLLVLPFSEKLRQRFLKKYGPSFGLALFRDLFAGILSNRNEYFFSKKHSQSKVMPTIQILFGGLVVIQIRGTKINEADLKLIVSSLRTNATFATANLDIAGQWCRHPDGTLRVCDYGELATLRLLESYSGCLWHEELRSLPHSLSEQ